MLLDNIVYKKSIYKLLEETDIKWDDFRNKRFLISGATGLIGATLVNTILASNHIYNTECKMYLLVRNIDKAEEIFGKSEYINLILCKDIRNISDFNEKVDFVIHAASKTASKDFVNFPIDTIMTNVLGSKNMLDIAKCVNAKKFIYLSTMEVYGVHNEDKKIKETEEINCRTDIVRNSYPLSKMLAENLCASYSAECGIETCILRLTQTFGPGVKYNDERVFAEFARCAVEGRDIILKTKGETKRSYLYTTDAVSAILQVLNIKSNYCEVYNVANEDSYCSIYDMACMIAELYKDKNICVKIEEQDINKLGYAPVLKINMDTRKLRSTGWKPKYTLPDAFINLIDWMKSEHNDIYKSKE